DAASSLLQALLVRHRLSMTGFVFFIDGGTQALVGHVAQSLFHAAERLDHIVRTIDRVHQRPASRAMTGNGSRPGASFPSGSNATFTRSINAALGNGIPNPSRFGAPASRSIQPSRVSAACRAAARSRSSSHAM